MLNESRQVVPLASTRSEVGKIVFQERCVILQEALRKGVGAFGLVFSDDSAELVQYGIILQTECVLFNLVALNLAVQYGMILQTECVMFNLVARNIDLFAFTICI